MYVEAYSQDDAPLSSWLRNRASRWWVYSVILIPYLVVLLPYTYRRVRSPGLRAALIAWAVFDLFIGVVSH